MEYLLRHNTVIVNSWTNNELCKTWFNWACYGHCSLKRFKSFNFPDDNLLFCKCVILVLYTVEKIVWTFKTPPYLPHNLCSNSISASLSQFLNFSKSVRSVERREYARSFHSLSREEYGKTRDRRNFLIALPWPSFFLIEYYILSRKR